MAGDQITFARIEGLTGQPSRIVVAAPAQMPGLTNQNQNMDGAGNVLGSTAALPMFVSYPASIPAGTTITIKDTLFTLQDDGDTTKQAVFQLSGITTGTTRTLTVPDASGTLAVLGLAQRWTAAQTMAASMLLLENPAATFSYTIVPAAITAARNLNLPLITGADTLAVLGLAQTWTALQSFGTNLGGTLQTAAQPNVTSLGTLTGLTVSGGAIIQNSGAITVSVGGEGYGVNIQGVLAEAGSGVHSVMGALRIAPGFTNGGATTTDAVGIIIAGFDSSGIAPTRATGLSVAVPTGGTNNYSINVTSGDIYKNGTAYNNPDYVLEHWATGRIVQFADRDGADRYTGLMPLAEVEAFARQTFMLPQIADFRALANESGRDGLFGGGDAVLASVEQSFLYLFDHERRLAALEARA